MQVANDSDSLYDVGMSTQRVEATLGDGVYHPGVIDRIRDSEVRVLFDDPLINGGTGAAWVNHDQIREDSSR